MAIQNILDKIKNDALDESNKLKAENSKEAGRINEEFEKEIRALEAETEELSKKRYEEEKRLKISLATLELKNKLLAAKQDLIDKAFEKALTEIKALPADRYKELLMTAILKVDVTGDEEIILGAEDSSKLGEGFVDDMNTAFSKSGRHSKFTLIDETREAISGCILKDGRTETICSFESIISGKRKELEREIATLLFKE